MEYLLDKKKTKIEVEAAFERYRIYKFLNFEQRESKITTSVAPRYHGLTNVISDQTAAVAVHNVDEQKKRNEYIELIDTIVSQLPIQERFLINERYLCQEADYLTDYNIYCFKFDPPISEKTYAKIRWRAMSKIALTLEIAVKKQA